MPYGWLIRSRRDTLWGLPSSFHHRAKITALSFHSIYLLLIRVSTGSHQRPVVVVFDCCAGGRGGKKTCLLIYAYVSIKCKELRRNEIIKLKKILLSAVHAQHAHPPPPDGNLKPSSSSPPSSWSLITSFHWMRRWWMKFITSGRSPCRSAFNERTTTGATTTFIRAETH